MAGEFVNNPLVASIGAHLGLSGLLGSGTEAATQAAVPAQITPPKSGATMATMRDERLQENLSRPKTVARAASTRGSQPGVAPNMPGVMDSPRSDASRCSAATRAIWDHTRKTAAALCRTQAPIYSLRIRLLTLITQFYLVWWSEHSKVWRLPTVATRSARA